MSAAPASATELCLHVGAHKTATTWLQSRLAAGQAALRQRDIDFEPRGSIATGFTQPMKHFIRTGDEASRDAAAACMAALLDRGYRRLIVSEENLLGDTSWILRASRFYDDATPRLRLVASLLPKPPIRVVLTIRSYASFLVSTYGEAVRFYPVRPFKACYPRLYQSDTMWIGLIESLAEVFGSERLAVLRYEALPDGLPAWLEALCGEPFDPALLPEAHDRREGLSARAVAELGRVGRPADFHGIVARFPRGPEYPAFDPWTAEERSRLDALYADHLDEIGRRWPGILV